LGVFFSPGGSVHCNIILVAITDETGKTERFKSQSMTVSRTPADYLCSTYNYLSNMKKNQPSQISLDLKRQSVKTVFFSPNALTMPQPSELLAEMKEKYTWEVLIITETKSLCFFV